MRKITQYLLLGLLMLSAWGCRKVNPLPVVNRTMLVYMAANTNMGSAYNGENDMAEMVTAARNGGLNGGALLVFRRPAGGGKSQLFRIEKGKNSPILLKEYDDQKATDPTLLRTVIDDVKKIAPARSYILTLWSHASGWLPGTQKAPVGRSFGRDGADEMDLSGLVWAVPEGMFDLIIYDVCNMGCVEVQYAMRKKSPYAIAAPGETDIEGMPYDKILPLLFRTTPDYEAVCKAYMETCYPRWGGTMALYDCAQMEPLAEVTARVVDQYRDQIPLIDDSMLQFFDPKGTFYHWDFDLLQFVKTLALPSDPQLVEEFEQALARVVLYKETTRIAFDRPINHFSGLGVYVPVSRFEGLSRTAYYYTTDWYRRVYEGL